MRAKPHNILISKGEPSRKIQSPYLFVLVIEIMATMIRNSTEIKGFSIEDEIVKIILFADDTTFFLKSRYERRVLGHGRSGATAVNPLIPVSPE